MVVLWLVLVLVLCCANSVVKCAVLMSGLSCVSSPVQAPLLFSLELFVVVCFLLCHFV